MATKTWVVTDETDADGQHWGLYSPTGDLWDYYESQEEARDQAEVLTRRDRVNALREHCGELLDAAEDLDTDRAIWSLELVETILNGLTD